MTFWTPGNEFPPDKSQSRTTTTEVDETPLVNRNYMPDVEESSDHQALLLGTSTEDNEGQEEDYDDPLMLAAQLPPPPQQQQQQQQQHHGILSPSAPPPHPSSSIIQMSQAVSPPQYHIPFETYARDDRILTRSLQVNAFSTELYSFLQQRNTVPPKIFVRIRGTSNGYEHYRRTYDTNGQQVTVEPINVKSGSYIPSVDFDCSIDCSHFVARTSDGFHVLPDRKTGYVKSVQELCKDYVQDTHRLKELQLNKVLSNWDEDLFIRLLKSNIRSHGYSHKLDITIEKRETKVTVKPASLLSQIVDNVYIRLFFYFTLLFIFVWPVLLFWRKKIGHKTLQSHWRMTVSEKEWCQHYLEEILGQIPPARCGPIVPISAVDP
ncbi:hypothetical protein BDA99DRAFT_496308 [Phascolomyces articulosus]|uniref:Uncharacterized protein n=1 Tax=Phascolomyces articulosus TaxID=60185 RepID=A0AAD5PJ54_9FUNG|nr:hypothetical protein BDA99DRAFT_496308 [Phascolomyces articulosus]